MFYYTSLRAPPSSTRSSLKMSSALFLSLLCAAFVALAASQGVHFDCPALPPLTQPAKTVYELKPQDIKVVMALGDSITAGRDDAQQKRKALCSYIYMYIQQWLCCHVSHCRCACLQDSA